MARNTMRLGALRGRRRLRDEMVLIDKGGERPICHECHRPFVATSKQLAEFRRVGALILCQRHREQWRTEATRNAEASRAFLAAYWRCFGAG